MDFFKKKPGTGTAIVVTDKKVRLNIKSLPWQKYIYPAAIIIATTAICLVMSFLYANVYKTIAQAEVVTNLKGKVVEEQLQQTLFVQIIDKIKKKQEGIKIDFNVLKNPLEFNSNIKESPTASTTATN